MRERFIGLLSEAQRPGMDKLIDWMTNKSDFLTAPASTQYHGSVEQGLLVHSLQVYDSLCLVLQISPEKVNPETAVICALLHDVCKANFYKTSTRNVKNEETGVWEKKPFFMIEDKFPYGHGEKSVYIINEFIHLNVEEAMTIRWHMGAFGAESYAERQALNAAMDKYPLILALQVADMMATFWNKK